AGTPLCPVALIAAVSPYAKTCTINATGSDNINLATGRGDFGGTFTVVVQGDNPTDSPELVVMKGTFKGKMDFSPAVLFGIPLGYVSGKLSDGRGSTFAFTGWHGIRSVWPIVAVRCGGVRRRADSTQSNEQLQSRCRHAALVSHG